MLRMSSRRSAGREAGMRAQAGIGHCLTFSKPTAFRISARRGSLEPLAEHRNKRRAPPLAEAVLFRPHHEPLDVVLLGHGHELLDDTADEVVAHGLREGVVVV